jgi:hypothetical protein
MHDGHQRPASGRWLLLRIAAARTQRVHRRVNSRVREIQRGQGQNRELQAFRPASALKPPPFPAPNHPRKAGVEGSNPSVGLAFQSQIRAVASSLRVARVQNAYISDPRSCRAGSAKTTWATATGAGTRRQLRLQRAQVDVHKLRLQRVLGRRPRAARARDVDPAALPAERGISVGRGDRLPRLAGFRWAAASGR